MVWIFPYFWFWISLYVDLRGLPRYLGVTSSLLYCFHFLAYFSKIPRAASVWVDSMWRNQSLSLVRRCEGKYYEQKDEVSIQDLYDQWYIYIYINVTTTLFLCYDIIYTYIKLTYSSERKITPLSIVRIPRFKPSNFVSRRLYYGLKKKHHFLLKQTVFFFQTKSITVWRFLSVLGPRHSRWARAQAS